MEVIDINAKEGLRVQSAAYPLVPNPALPGLIKASHQEMLKILFFNLFF
jgi:hypothetical protein